MDMQEILGYAKEAFGITVKGLITGNSPLVFRGIINELFRQYEITPEKVVPLVQQNEELWSLIDPSRYEQIRIGVSQAGDLSWLTSDWIIDAIRQEHAALASMFLSWRKSKNWLDRQIVNIKKEVVLD